MASFIKHNSFVEARNHGEHDLETDTLKLVLTNTLPAASDAQLTDLTEISAGNGYTAGGLEVTVSSSGQTSGTYKLVCADRTVTASGGSVGPFRYVTLLNDTSTNKLLIGSWDYGSSITLADTETFTADFSATNGVIQDA